jgi:predicted MPP superfamily phosphohydrolase
VALRGRGKNYTALRNAGEAVLSRAFASHWPARLARAARWQGGVSVVRHAIRCDGWPRGARRLRVAFASDFHAGPTTHESQLDAACDAIARAEPDLVLLGGDFVLFDAKHIVALAPRLARLRAPLGRFAVLGNHDLWADDARIVRALEDAGVRVLVNESRRLSPPFDHVVVAALDDAWTGSPDASRAFAEDADVRVLLMHSPDGLLFTRGARFDLALCGHTHGGHVALPGGVPIVVPGPLGRVHPHGRFAVQGGTLVVSRGVGAAEVPFRLFAPPDVVVCDLHGEH